MNYIRNKEALIGNAKTDLTKKARAVALKTLDHVLYSVDAKRLLKSLVKIEASNLIAGKHSFDLASFQNIYVVGGGKATGAMAQAIEDLLGKSITGGLVNVPYQDKHTTSIIELHQASHPLPDETGVEGTRRMMEIAEKADRDDLVIVLISGGGSSLMPMLRDGVSLHDKRELAEKLLKSGAGIDEINTVRKHLSGFKGGWLAKKAYPATILNLIISDVVGDSVETIASGPTVPDPTTFADARSVLLKYGLWRTAPDSIRSLIFNGCKGLVAETPKAGDVCFEKVHSAILGNNRTAALAALEFLRAEGLNALLLTSRLEGEARAAGRILSSIAAEIASSGNPVQKPAGIVISGETVVTVRGKGCGGRNQELALSAASTLQNINGVVIASMSTDGIDGPTDAAGAVVDGKTTERAKNLCLEPEKFLANNDSYRFFSTLGDLIVTGPTGTNVNDISLVVVL